MKRYALFAAAVILAEPADAGGKAELWMEPTVVLSTTRPLPRPECRVSLLVFSIPCDVRHRHSPVGEPRGGDPSGEDRPATGEVGVPDLPVANHDKNQELRDYCECDDPREGARQVKADHDGWPQVAKDHDSDNWAGVLTGVKP